MSSSLVQWASLSLRFDATYNDHSHVVLIIWHIYGQNAMFMVIMGVYKNDQTRASLFYQLGFCGHLGC